MVFHVHYVDESKANNPPKNLHPLCIIRRVHAAGSNPVYRLTNCGPLLIVAVFCS
jgi:hypothetical protein